MKNLATSCIACGNTGEFRISQMRQRGFSMLEMLVVLMMSAVLASIAVSNLKALDNPLQNGTAQMISFLKESRARAISQTVAYRITPSSTTRAVAGYATSCSAGTFTNDPSLTIELPNTTRFSAVGWSICFTSRGFTSVNTTIGIQDGAQVRSIQTMLGGGIREL